MIDKKIENILNQQINKEFYSAYLYLAISAYFDEIGLRGFAHWAKVQAREEVDHGMIIFDHILERDGDIQLTDISAPSTSFGNPDDVFKMILEHEKTITADINEITSDSDLNCDFATRNFINWYVAEQVEEEALVRYIVDKFELFNNDNAVLYHMDEELGKRQYEPPKL